MTRTTPTAPADADAPDPHRAAPGTPAHMPDWCVHLIALLIRFILQRLLAANQHRSRLASWCHDRPDLPPGSTQELAASIRGPFGTAIAWMCRRRGIGPGHPDWPELSRAIVAFGGSLSGFRPGLPACGLQWHENPAIVPGMIGETVATPAAAALASLLSRQAVGDIPPPAPEAAPATARYAPLPAARLSECRPTGLRARSSTGPPIGPPLPGAINLPASDERGRSMAGPAILIRAG